MQIADITKKSKKHKIDEVNWGAIGSALGDIAKQAVTGQTPQAAPGQEAAAAKKLVQPLTNQQTDATRKAWTQAVSAQMAQLGLTDPANIPAAELKKILDNFVTTRLFGNRYDIKMLGGRHRSRIENDIQNVIAQTQKNDANALSQAITSLANDAQSAMMFQTFNPAAQRIGVQQASPQTNILMQRMAPQIAQLQKSWPVGMTQQVSPTNNPAVNALLSGLGLLKGAKIPRGPTTGNTPPTGTPE